MPVRERYAGCATRRNASQRVQATLNSSLRLRFTFRSMAAFTVPFAAVAQLVTRLVSVCGGVVDRAVRGTVAIVVDGECAFIAGAVGVGKNVFVYRTGALEKVVEQEVLTFCKYPAAFEKRSNLALVTF